MSDGIDRYIEIAKQIYTLPGSSGELGPLYGHNRLSLYNKSAIVTIGIETQLFECIIDKELLFPNDIIYVEWWGIGSVGYDNVTINIYWNEILLGTVTPTTQSDARTFAITELNDNYMAFSMYPDQYSNILIMNWRQNGGAILITATSVVNQTLNMNMRIMRIIQ